MELKYRISEIDCANCALKLENKIAKIKGVNKAQINYMMETLILDIDEDNKNEILEKVMKTIKKNEPDCIVR